MIHRFHRSLADESWLIVSPAETSQTLFSEFASVSFAGATLYRKGTTPPQMVTASFSYAQDEVQFGVQAAECAIQESESARASDLETSLALPVQRLQPRSNSRTKTASTKLTKDQFAELETCARESGNLSEWCRDGPSPLVPKT